MKYFVFGIGMQDIHGKAAQINPEIFSITHNGTQQVIVSWGIVGIILIFVLFLQMIKIAKRRNPFIKLTNYIAFLFILLNVQAGQFITAEHSLLILSLSYVCMFINFREPEK